jgi:hypothetical protein
LYHICLFSLDFVFKSIKCCTCRNGHAFSTYILEPKIALSLIYDVLNRNGVKLVQKKVEHIAELKDDYDVVINCCGLGAVSLNGDEEFTPVKGHLLRVEAPWIHSMYGSFLDGGYIIPT